MAWLSRVNFVSSDTLSFTDINNLGNDIRAWGDNVNGGGYTLSNVVISASSGTVATVTGGTGAASTLTLRSTSGAGTSDAIVFVTGNAGANEALRLSSSGSANFGKIWTSGAQATGNVALSLGDLVSFGTSSAGAALTWDVQTLAGNASVMARLRPRWIANSGYALDVFAGSWNNAYDPGSAVATFQSTGNVGIGTASPGRLLDVRGLSAFSDGTQGLILGPYTGGSGYSAIYNFGTTPGSANYVFASSTSETILNNATRLVFAIGASEKMRIDSSGNVGIGTASPVSPARLDLTKSITSNDLTTMRQLRIGVDTNSDYSGYLGYGNNSSGFYGLVLQGVHANAPSASFIALNPGGGNVGIGTASPATSAKLEIAGTTGALLVPRLTTTERNALTAVNGMIIYNTTDNQMQGRINGAWVAM